MGSAGISEAFTTEQVRALFDVNVFGVQRTLRALLPTFRKQGDGLVVNIGSIPGRVPAREPMQRAHGPVNHGNHLNFSTCVPVRISALARLGTT
ncbi:SDR family NAD(P)-dependent oxidoreductase [Paraburkholderia sp. GAS334]|uniref:SDR family NAD(P)-dependent oxidoreductase n=1 Tax=Paraburkholderia sp. GAS334 TaxID=3035131 RepID=UPI003D1FED5E